jgi:hypothetical protein
MTETKTLKYPPPIKSILSQILLRDTAKITVLEIARDGRRRSAARREIASLGWAVDGTDLVTVTREQALAYCADYLRLSPTEPTAPAGDGAHQGWQYNPDYMRPDHLLWCLLHPDQVEIEKARDSYGWWLRTRASREAAQAAKIEAQKAALRQTRLPDLIAHVAPVADAETLRYAMRPRGLGALAAEGWDDPAGWAAKCAARRDELLAGIARAQAAIEALDAIEAWAAERTPEQIAGMIGAAIDEAIAPPADTAPDAALDTTPDTTVAAPAA